MSNLGDRAVGVVLAIAAVVLLLDCADALQDRWAAMELAEHPQAICRQVNGAWTCIDVKPVRMAWRGE